ncbi:hypothetical protein [Rhodococcus sp. 27YEA15]|uniref:hypothetical protein n=1 Tax=Rhodococcus sp. 27YEA15 TaxID=3156259 RepID=UPI003C7A23BC
MIADHSAITARLTSLVAAVDTEALARESGMGDVGSSVRVLVLGDFPHGYSSEDMAMVGYLAEEGNTIGLSILLVGESGSASMEPTSARLADVCLHLSAIGDDEVHDPWTGTAWRFEPDRLDPASQAHVLAHFGRR